MSKRVFLFLIFAGLLAACSSGDPSATPTQPDILRIAVSPALSPVGLAVSTCAAQHPETIILVEESFPEYAETNLVIRWGEPDTLPTFIAQIAEEELVIALHPDNPVGSLNITQIEDIFSGRIQNWSELGGENVDIQVWALMEVDETRQIFDEYILKGGRLTPKAWLAPTAADLADAVAKDPTAIGYLPLAARTSSISTILLGVRLPILVVSQTAPAGVMGELVACLQGETGQDLLTPFYSP